MLQVDSSFINNGMQNIKCVVFSSSNNKEEDLEECIKEEDLEASVPNVSRYSMMVPCKAIE